METRYCTATPRSSGLPKRRRHRNFKSASGLCDSTNERYTSVLIKTAIHDWAVHRAERRDGPLDKRAEVGHKVLESSAQMVQPLTWFVSARRLSTSRACPLGDLSSKQAGRTRRSRCSRTATCVCEAGSSCNEVGAPDHDDSSAGANCSLPFGYFSSLQPGRTYEHIRTEPARGYPLGQSVRSSPPGTIAYRLS